ncbi:unnamed protein product [Vitrella brassicaformis CCMP3155]|uniref:Uncharacterized protein n=1 Tax=Vitrella brassicaformis (strain CCMP3155) TaxID=1169540 RepID=A0A0G4EQ53_VITBC|nr:unnamed protein product [Vitrella brassicaformis CCMP3155]|eukprot:CEL99734.1 unnamed protein product [Vitrella brassicaformis CCMP3155]
MERCEAFARLWLPRWCGNGPRYAFASFSLFLGQQGDESHQGFAKAAKKDEQRPDNEEFAEHFDQRETYCRARATRTTTVDVWWMDFGRQYAHPMHSHPSWFLGYQGDDNSSGGDEEREAADAGQMEDQRKQQEERQEEEAADEQHDQQQHEQQPAPIKVHQLKQQAATVQQKTYVYLWGDDATDVGLPAADLWALTHRNRHTSPALGQGLLPISMLHGMACVACRFVTEAEMQAAVELAEREGTDEEPEGMSWVGFNQQYAHPVHSHPQWFLGNYGDEIPFAGGSADEEREAAERRQMAEEEAAEQQRRQMAEQDDQQQPAAIQPVGPAHTHLAAHREFWWVVGFNGQYAHSVRSHPSWFLGYQGDDSHFVGGSDEQQQEAEPQMDQQEQEERQEEENRRLHFISCGSYFIRPSPSGLDAAALFGQRESSGAEESTDTEPKSLASQCQAAERQEVQQSG